MRGCELCIKQHNIVAFTINVLPRLQMNGHKIGFIKGKKAESILKLSLKLNLICSSDCCVK